MAQIRKYTAQETISPPSMLQTRVDNPVGKAVQQLGGQIEGVADYFQQREEKKQDFKAENDYRRMNLQLGADMDKQAESMPEDGTGFHDGFVNNVYKPTRDKFLAGLPERLRDKYSVLLKDESPDGGGSDTAAWSIKAASKERDQLWGWYDNQLKTGQSELQTAISMDPDSYDTLHEQGLKEIEASGLPESKKAEQRQAWTRMAQVAHLNKMIESRPEQVLRDLGADPRMLTPTTQFSLLSGAVQHTESGGNVAAISRTGAVGLMQVQPNTAKDISKWMGDGLIDKNMSDERITSIISNPTVNKQYGDFYLKKMIKDYSAKGGLEAALIAYNGGPQRAEEWIKSGFDDSVLPKETRDYYKKVMKQLPSMSGTSDKGPKGDPNGVQLVFSDRTDIAGQDEGHVSQDLTGRVKTAFAGLGIDRVKINSGFRSSEDNARVGGAKGSQHMHGNAVDIDVSGYSIAERVNIIKSLSASGVTGLGIGSNIIHADVGGRRAWGYAGSAGGGAVPKWAQEAIAEHLENRAAAPNRPAGVAGRYSGLPYADRQKYIGAADTALTQMQAQQNKATSLQKVELRTAMTNELATLQATGKSTDLVDDTAVSTVLGEDDYAKWVNQRETARRTFAARDGIGGMTLDEMDTRLADYKPDPGSPTFADDQKVEASVQKEIDRVTRLRTSRPTEAAMMFPDVKKAWDTVDSAENPAPEAVQEFVRLNLERQKEFGLKPGSEQPIPRAWAVQIGQSLSRIPEVKGRNSADVNASIVVMYDNLHKVFGDYTDEVVINALREYKGVGPNTAELLNGYMQAIQAGGDPLARIRQNQDKALDRDQVEGVSGKGFWGTAWDFVTGTDHEDEDKGLRPFNPGERRNNGDGSYSTEVTTTWQLPDGKWVNAPSLWKDGKGKNVQFGNTDEDGILGALKAYESRSGKPFKRFDSEEAAVAAAKAKSAAGGVDAPDGEGVNDEQLLRAMSTLENLGEDMSPEQEQSLVRRFGQKTVDAAKARIGNGN